MDNKIIIAVVIALIIGASGGFWGGMQYQKSKADSEGNQAGVAQFPRGNMSQEEREELREQMRSGELPEGFTPPDGFNPQGGGFRGAVSGEIIDRDEESITVKLEDGSSRIIFVDSETQINISSLGTQSDFKKGIQVAVNGSENDDGSIDARMVQIREGE